nr:MAG TPA: hypothetical protein [Caudoviricetes sp.]
MKIKRAVIIINKAIEILIFLFELIALIPCAPALLLANVYDWTDRKLEEYEE